jgi:hypothetical protein
MYLIKVSFFFLLPLVYLRIPFLQLLGNPENFAYKFYQQIFLFHKDFKLKVRPDYELLVSFHFVRTYSHNKFFLFIYLVYQVN